MANSIDQYTGFAIENKIICSTKIAITNSFLHFRETLDSIFSNKLLFSNSDRQFFHTFLKMLSLLDFKISNNLHKSEEKFQLTRIDCIPFSSKFYFPSNVVSLRKDKNLILKLDDDYDSDGTCETLNTCSLFKNNKTNIGHLIEPINIVIEDAFGMSFPCNKKHEHSSCLKTLNESIESEKIMNKEYNATQKGIDLFDTLINWIKIAQHVDFELMAILYLEILNDQSYSKSLNEIKQKINILNNKINLKDFGYFILYSINRNSKIYLTSELIECHTAQNILKQDTVANAQQQIQQIDFFLDHTFE
jgi:hypothetical protein